MSVTVLIAHANGEEDRAKELAAPIQAAGYDVHYGATVLVGESVVEETQKVLNAGGPVVLCGTIRAVGTPWARRVVNAARQANRQNRVFVVQMEEDADTESVAFDGKVAAWWHNQAKAADDLVTALVRYFPLDRTIAESSAATTAEARYRQLALESCDLVDLVNLPEGDRHIALRQLELRRLYVALRVRPTSVRGERLGGAQPDAGTQDRVPLGERLAADRRLVVLGDPGSGKSTLLRWITTAYLLRLADDPDWRDLPDVGTLPEEDLLPVLIRCRDLRSDHIGGAFDDVLNFTLRQQEMNDQECAALRELLRGRLTDGTALLLLDGLDEIADPMLRAKFSQQIERIATAYPKAPIVTTCRVVGYREMGYRIGRGFTHVVVDPLEAGEKDEFASRWCALAEPPERRESATAELISDVHSTPQIEALTGNPMLLTTMALVKRKVGKLPSRRADLYWEAVQVLLNWRREIDLPLDSREAMPQLEYLAYTMCDRGVQRLREDEVLDVLAAMRAEFPQVYAAQSRTPSAFLALVEDRTGLLAQAGEIRHNGRPVPVYEFRHLTFQEYLAARALVEGHHPGHDPKGTLADAVLPLVIRTASAPDSKGSQSWLETVRLCVASCNDADAEEILQGLVADRFSDEEFAPHLNLLATDCLTDEPNVSATLVRTVVDTALQRSRPELAKLVRTRWRSEVVQRVVAACTGDWERDVALIQDLFLDDYLEGRRPQTLDAEEVRETLRSPDHTVRLQAAHTVVLVVANHRGALPAKLITGLTAELVPLLDEPRPMAMTAAWALGWVYAPERAPDATLPADLIQRCASLLRDEQTDPAFARFLLWLVPAARSGDQTGELANLQEAALLWFTRAAPAHVADALTIRYPMSHPMRARLVALFAESPSARIRKPTVLMVRIDDPAELGPLLARLAKEDDKGVLESGLERVAYVRWSDHRYADLRDSASRFVTGFDPASDEQAIWVDLVQTGLGTPGARQRIVERLQGGDRARRIRTLKTVAACCLDLRSQDSLLPLPPPFDLTDHDPIDMIPADGLRAYAREVGLPPDDVLRRYEVFAREWGLWLDWVQEM
ncbi:TIR domain-containing protein [Asanoa ferruginea]|uniref:TIR domain-containing protein n=1 Tax=Asanoa ferruginea TaxID=53367 RepID=A0A3D9ZJQ0_9ACTN|nr:NACHT domain-containing protein [Asanoa ferruginea]REF97079.1 TIR domain-containing protein [Asanoa ferruginea]GIF50489.1 hypothetical protein Afe04nite_50280 [Asanoa ferruginea]